nr:DUF4244 domain-containing protein [Streptomyces armeniacus]
MVARVCRSVRSRWHRARCVRRGGDRGMATAEYAVGTIAACAFAAVLYKILTSAGVGSALQQMIEKALNAAG